MASMLAFAKNGSRSNWSEIDCDEFDEIYYIQVIHIVISICYPFFYLLMYFIELRK